MKKHCLLFLLAGLYSQLNGQDKQEQQQVKSITLQAYESVSQATRQWFVDVANKHPAGSFDTAYAIRTLKEKFTTEQLNNAGDIFVCMMALQKMISKEAKEDRTIQRLVNQRMLASKAEKIKLDNQSIDKGMQEAGEKANAAMDAATVSLLSTILNGSIQAAATSLSQGKKNTFVKDTARSKLKIIRRDPPYKSTDKLSLSEYIKKLETQLAILQKSVI